jgi:hypothetical protein
MTPPRQSGAMSALRLTRAQRRLMQKLADRGDRVTQVDGLFFERGSDRRQLVVSSHTPEIEARLHTAAGGRP